MLPEQTHKQIDMIQQFYLLGKYETENVNKFPQKFKSFKRF